MVLTLTDRRFSMPSDLIRITLLSPRSARVELSPSGEFLAGPSFFFMQRGEPLPWPHRERVGEWRVHRSEHLEIRVRDGARDLSADTLEVHWTLDERSGVWRPGDVDEANLGSSFSALDNCNRLITAEGVHPFDPMDGHDAHRCSTHDLFRALDAALRPHMGRHPELKERDEEMTRLMLGKPSLWMPEFPPEVYEALAKVRRFPPGFLTRSGLTVVRDTGPMWDPEAQWFSPRPGGHIDLTLIACGDDFKGTLGEIARLSGPIPLLPRWALGVWFSCYRKMGAREFEQIARDFDVHGLPLDVLVVDTDWHERRWHGFDWNRDLFPKPAAFFEWLRREGLHTTFNVHPGFIPASDSRLPAYREQSGCDSPPLTAEEAPHPLHADCVPVDLTDPGQARAWFDVFHRPITEMGCDLWWIDGAMGHWDGDEGTAWLNHLYHRHARERGSAAPLAFSRASGLGNHRTTLAFSGDAWVQWEVLAQEVESTIRGACSLMAHWSHDIGGFWNSDFKENRPPDDLFVRWTQFGCLSPIMRYHSDHGVREPWLFGEEVLRLCREALLLRMRLVPHLEKLVREAHETGVAPWRPMCLEFPREEDAFCRWHQAMIGEGLLFAPVTKSSGDVEVWFPPGSWQHLQTQRVIEGPCVERWRADLGEIPLFLRGGYSLSLAPPARRTRDIDESAQS
ncbi:hypothetical protein JXA47_04910 [Candidatus Sumerlaeota bacterium]|nr:hypothetical protein [Candidatus Sumerlaeota bacterium]